MFAGYAVLTRLQFDLVNGHHVFTAFEPLCFYKTVYYFSVSIYHKHLLFQHESSSPIHGQNPEILGLLHLEHEIGAVSVVLWTLCRFVVVKRELS